MGTKARSNDRIVAYGQLTEEILSSAFDGGIKALKTLVLDTKQNREFCAALNGDIYKSLPKARMALMLRLESLKSDGSKMSDFKHL